MVKDRHRRKGGTEVRGYQQNLSVGLGSAEKSWSQQFWLHREHQQHQVLLAKQRGKGNSTVLSKCRIEHFRTNRITITLHKSWLCLHPSHLHLWRHLHQGRPQHVPSSHLLRAIHKPSTYCQYLLKRGLHYQLVKLAVRIIDPPTSVPVASYDRCKPSKTPAHQTPT